MREVPLGEFKTKFGGDVNAVLMESINQRLLAARVSLISSNQLINSPRGTAYPSRSRPCWKAPVFAAVYSMGSSSTHAESTCTCLIALCVQSAAAGAAQDTAAAARGAAAVARTGRKSRDAAAAGEDQQPAEGAATVRHSLATRQFHSFLYVIITGQVLCGAC